MPPARVQPQQPVHRIAPLGVLNAYTVYEHELETLARGTPAGLFLNFALALLPTAVGILTTVRSSTMTDLNFTLFTCASIIFIIAGGICLALWWQQHRSAAALVQVIKRRMPPEGIQETTPPAGRAAVAPPTPSGPPPAAP